MSSTEEDIILIEASGLMQEAWDLRQYPDARRSGMGAAEHYLQTGSRLLYDPAPTFSSRRYLRAHPDVAAAGMNPLLHYLLHGRREGRACFPAAAYTAADDPPELYASDQLAVPRHVPANPRPPLFY